jgi:hypothetical protein
MHIWRFGIVVLVGLAAIAGGAGQRRNVHTLQTTNDSAVECNSRDPLSPCATDFNSAYPIGDGLFITLLEDLF